MGMHGRHHSEETKERFSNINTGKTMSTESREKMRLKAVGNSSHSGHKLTDEQKANIAEKTRLAMQNPAIREKLSKAHTGLKQSKETIDRRTSKNKGKKRSQEFKDRISQKAKERWQTEEYKTKQTEAKKDIGGWHITEEHKAIISEYHKGVKRTEQAKINIGNGRRGKGVGVKHTDEHKKKISEASKRNWQNPEYRQKTVTATMKAAHRRPTKPELKLGELLDQACPGEYEYVGDGKVIIGGLCPDFIHSNGTHKVVLMHGDYWHKGEDVDVTIGRYNEEGYDCLVIWERQLRYENKVLIRIGEFNNEK